MCGCSHVSPDKGSEDAIFLGKQILRSIVLQDVPSLHDDDQVCSEDGVNPVLPRRKSNRGFHLENSHQWASCKANPIGERLSLFTVIFGIDLCTLTWWDFQLLYSLCHQAWKYLSISFTFCHYGQHSCWNKSYGPTETHLPLWEIGMRSILHCQVA